MNKEKIWLSSPHMGEQEQQFVKEAFDANWIAPLGPNVTGFEADLGSYLQKDIYVAALSSGTAALHLALVGGITTHLCKPPVPKGGKRPPPAPLPSLY